MNETNTTVKIKAIDSHIHINHGSKWDRQNEGMCETSYLENLLQINEASHIEKMFCSTFASVISTEVVEKENEYMFQMT